MAVSGTYCYVITGGWLHKMDVTGDASVRKSVNLGEALMSAQQGGRGPQGMGMMGGGAQVDVSDAQVYVLAGSTLLEFDLNLNKPRVVDLGQALQEVMRQQGPGAGRGQGFGRGQGPGQGGRGQGGPGQGGGQRGFGGRGRGGRGGGFGGQGQNGPGNGGR
jgi:hypothetical protein